MAGGQGLESRGNKVDVCCGEVDATIESPCISTGGSFLSAYLLCVL